MDVCFTQRKSCFVQINSHHIKLDSSSKLTVVRVSHGDCVCYLCADSCGRADTETLSINGFLANKLGLVNSAKVNVETIPNPANCIRASIEPVSTDDWQIIELNASFIQSHLLDQLRVVWPGAVLPIWVSGNVCVFIRIGELFPSTQSCLLLTQLTELVVSPKGSRTTPPPVPNSSTHSSKPTSNGTAIHTTPHSLSPPSDMAKGHRSSASLDSGIGVTPSSDSVRADFEDLQRYHSVEAASADAEMDEGVDNRMTTSLTSSILSNLSTWWTGVAQTSSPPTPNRSGNILGYPCPQFPNVYGKVRSKTTADGPEGCNTILLSRDSFSKKFLPQLFLASLSTVLSPLEYEDEEKLQARIRKQSKSTASSAIKVTKSVCTVLVKVLDNPEAGNIIYLPASFCKLHRIKPTSIVLISPCTTNRCDIQQIQIQPTHTLPEFINEDLMKVAFKRYIIDSTEKLRKPYVLTAVNVLTVPIHPNETADLLVSIDSKKSEDKSDETTSIGLRPSGKNCYCFLGRSDLDCVSIIYERQITNRCKFELEPELMMKIPKYTSPPSTCPNCYSKSLEFVESSVMSQLCGALLLTGEKGCGKTTLCKHLMNHFYRRRYYYVHSINCKAIRGKRPDAMLRWLDTIIQECIRKQPSVLFVDDLEVIARSPSGPEEEMNPEFIYSCKVAEVLIDLLNKMWRRPDVQVSVVFTAASREAINEKLTSASGYHFFHFTLEIPPLNADRAADVIRSLCDHLMLTSYPSKPELIPFCKKLDGYVAQDLSLLVNRAAHAHTIVCKKGPADMVTIHDLMAALEGFTPASLRNVRLHKPGDVGWQDVGGLNSVKQELIKMLQWPSKFPSLYSKCPIRLQSGVLLYGAPGTGKTLMAAVVAKEMTLNFISIKGPELLNKYIGASEKAVRDTFLRAQSARPCILFFDEFESLAPRRGHDSTGVTDRVVNQLLTQLDGVESLEGVYVMAATSRPDLIDPALLRPGRLDKSLLCDIPTTEERREIFLALMHNLNLASDVNVNTVSDRCDHFTGADIKSLLTNAQLEAVHAVMDSKELKKKSTPKSGGDSNVQGFVLDLRASRCDIIQPSQAFYQQLCNVISKQSATCSTTEDESKAMEGDFAVIITQEQLENAASNTQPSISARERLKYKRIYDQFSGKAPQQPSDLMQKVSLA